MTTPLPSADKLNDHLSVFLLFALPMCDEIKELGDSDSVLQAARERNTATSLRRLASVTRENLEGIAASMEGIAEDLELLRELAEEE